MVKTKHNKAKKKKKSSWDETQHPTNRHRRAKAITPLRATEFPPQDTKAPGKTETQGNATSLTGRAPT